MNVRLLPAVLPLLWAGSVAGASRGVTLTVLVDRTMFTGQPGREGQVRQLVLQAVTRLVPGVDHVRLGSLCGPPRTVFQAPVSRDLGPLATALDRDVLRPCTVRGSRLNAGLRWATTGPAGATLLVTDAAFSDDPERAALPVTARVFRPVLGVIGARPEDRDAFDALFREAPGYLGTRGLNDAEAFLRLLLRKVRR